MAGSSDSPLVDQVFLPPWTTVEISWTALWASDSLEFPNLLVPVIFPASQGLAKPASLTYITVDVYLCKTALSHTSL